MLRIALALLLSFAAPVAVAARPPNVVVSIQPVHSLVAAVMAGVGEPRLLIRGTTSEHVFTLRPSDAQSLEAAEIVFWIGDDLETFLAKPLGALASRARIVALGEESGIALLEAREGGAWEEREPHSASANEQAAKHGDGHEDRHDHEHDLHVWLDPDNARRMAGTIADVLSMADPTNAPRYTENAGRLAVRLAALDAELSAALEPVRTVPFVVFHDAYHYFERRYGLRSVGSVTLSPERLPGPRRLYDVRAKIRDVGARCVFSEPQYDDSLVRTVIEGTGARTARLDPLGADIPPGPDAYAAMMRGIAAAIRGCLASD